MLPSESRRVTPPTPNFDTNNNVVGLNEKTNQLLLPSMQWRPVGPPSPNSAINTNPTLAQQNFADLPPAQENLFLPSLQTWRPVSPPKSNTGHNSVTPIGEINFASSKNENQQVLLPSLEKGPVTPPGSNPGHNFVPPTPSLARSKLRSQHILLPSLQKGPVTSPGFSPGHNSVPPIGEKSFAYLKMIKNHNLIPYSQKLRPTTPPGTDVEQNSSGCNMGTKKKFAARKMGAARLPPVAVSLKASY
nr:nascent polypeptide-associated complex subunit alpha, muscle-specific form-like [Ipomoea trifida]